MHSIFHTAKYFLKVINYSQVLQSTIKLFFPLANFSTSQGQNLYSKNRNGPEVQLSVMEMGISQF